MSKEKTPSRYRIDLCDGYYAMKDNYCYTLYNTRNKQATALHPDIDENETKDINLGYFDGFDNMLWAMVNNSVDAKALSKDNSEDYSITELFSNNKNANARLIAKEC